MAKEGSLRPARDLGDERSRAPLRPWNENLRFLQGQESVYTAEATMPFQNTNSAAATE